MIRKKIYVFVDLSVVLYFISKCNRMNYILSLFSFSLNLRSVTVATLNLQ
jgi:hypothetical protein